MMGEFFIIKRQFKKYISGIFTNKDDKILDIGCGEKPFYHKFTRGKITCFDIRKTNKANIVGNADFLPFKKNSFDKVIIVNSLYYFKNPFKVIEKVGSILKSNGKIVIIIPFFYPIHDVPDDRYRFSEYGLKTLLEEHFKIEKIESIGGFFNIPAVLLHSLLKGLPLTVPKSLKGIVQFISYAIFYIPYILAQIISILDVLDRTKRFPTYYLAIATKK